MVRKYVSAGGRLLSVDPVKDGSNWYGYVHHDPVNYTDLLGLMENDGPLQQGPLKQNDPALNGIPNMSTDGCYIRCLQYSVAMAYLKRPMTVEEITASIKSLQEKGLLDSEMEVQHTPRVVAEIAKSFGVDIKKKEDISFEKFEEDEADQAVGDIVIERIWTALDNPHFRVKDGFDPYYRPPVRDDSKMPGYFRYYVITLPTLQL